MLDNPRRLWAEMDIPQRHVAVKEGLARGATASAIGALLHTSRSAICAHVYRYRSELGLPPADPRGGVKAKQARAVKAEKKPKKRRNRPSFFRLPPVEADRVTPDMGPLRAENWQALPETEPVSLLDLGLRDCRWPIGEKPTMYCGQPAKDGRPYCTGHCQLAYQPKAA